MPCAVPEKLLMPNGRCRVHGGATPSGAASPHFKTGRYSGALPERLLARYQELKADPDLTSLASEIAVVRARIFSLLERLGANEPARLWGELNAAWADLVAARAAGNTGNMADALNEIGRLIESGAGEAASWREIGVEIDRVNRLVAQEARQQQLAEATITIERALVWAGAVGAILRDHIHDPDILRAILNRIRGTLMVSPGGRVIDQ